MSNIVTASFHPDQRSAWTAPLYQYDYGQILQFEGLTLPASYEVHCSNSETGEAIVLNGNENGVSIPDRFLTTGRPIYLWVFLHTGEHDGETKYQVVIPVTPRAKPVETDSDTVIPIGTVAVNRFKIPIDLTDAQAIYITYQQDDKTVLEKALGEEGVSVTEDEIIVQLSQEDTLRFSENSQVRIQIRAKLANGDPIKSGIIVTSTDELLKEDVI